LFGLLLKVDTLAFQEQDQVAAACATSALWSVFQGTGILFQHPIPSPVEITNIASAHSPLETRTLPNKNGLNIAQMAHAIKSVGLEPFLVRAYDDFFLKGTLYAYLNGKIPILMGLDLVDISTQPHSYIGKHAVAVTGYSLGGRTATPYKCGQKEFLLKATRIDKIYAHDDQVGPFARMPIHNSKVKLKRNGGDQEIDFFISTGWRGKNGELDSVRAISPMILVPLYHKIRIPFDVVLNSILPLDGLIGEAGKANIISLKNRLEWDIYLATINDFKRDVFQSNNFKNGEYRQEILLENMPRFVWRAVARCEDVPCLELLFDATDIEQGSFFIRGIEYDPQLSIFLRSADIYKIPELKIFNWFEKNPSPHQPNK
jgi:hypothetical protein